MAEQITEATTGAINSYILGWVRIAKWDTTGYYDGIAATITLRGIWGNNSAGTGAMKFDVAVSYPNTFKIGNVVGVNKFTRARLVVEDGATWLDVYTNQSGGGVIVNIQNYGFGPVTFSLKQVSGDASDGVPLYNN